MQLYIGQCIPWVRSTHCTPSPLPCIDLILLVAFPRRTLWGSPGICDCTLTNAFPRVKGLRVWDRVFVLLAVVVVVVFVV